MFTSKGQTLLGDNTPIQLRWLFVAMGISVGVGVFSANAAVNLEHRLSRIEAKLDALEARTANR